MLFTSPRLGDELTWFDLVETPGTGSALFVGVYNHAGQRGWDAGVAIIPFDGHFREVQLLGNGLNGGSMLAKDKQTLYLWSGGSPKTYRGTIINCTQCTQHFAVRSFTWDGRHLTLGQERRTRLMYKPGTSAPVFEPPIKPEAYSAYRAGLAATGAGNFPRARELFTEAVLLDETFPDALNENAYTFIFERRWEEAIPLLDRALEIDKEHGGARYNRGLALFNLGRYQQAEEDAAYAVLLQPNHPESKLLMEQVRTMLKR